MSFVRRSTTGQSSGAKSVKGLLFGNAAPGSPLRHRSKYELRSISFEGNKVLPWTARSSATDTISRRGVLSRRCYGSVEMLPQIEQDGSDGGRRFRVENGDSPGEKEEMFGSPSTPVLENPEYQTRWYFKYFLGRLHQNYVASDQEKNPLFLSVVLSEGGDQCVPHYRAILWRRTGAQKISLPYSANKTMTVKHILSNYFGLEKLDKAPRELFSPELQKDLLLLEEQEGSVNFKFGVIFAKPGQTTDDEMLSNEQGSSGFEKFLDVLGERICLKGWDKYRGGLDVKGDMTGKESVYTVYAGHEVMYHVSTMLPYSRDNPQQLERKRHIGNDIVNVIYSDDPNFLTTFNPNCIRSQFTHVFAVVSPEPGDAGWRIAIYCDESVPLFGPSLPCPPVFGDPSNLREFLLVKLINGEKAAFDTPTFSRKRERTLDTLLKDMYQEQMPDSKGNSMLNRRALSDVVETPGRRREETRAVEMVRVGQALKLEAIVRGIAPTSLATVGPLKPRPWEPRCVYPDFPGEVICGDVWADRRLILTSETGTYLLEAIDGLSHRLLFDKTVPIKQLDVVEQHGILLFRAGEKGKESNIHVFRLSELETEAMMNATLDDSEDFVEEPNEPRIRSSSPKVPIARNRNHAKERKLDRSRGCHLYGITRPDASHLRMCIAVGRRLTVLQWKHSAAWTTWCSAADTDTVDGFLLVREFNASEPPLIVTIVSGTEPGTDWTICCGLRHHFELIWPDGASRSLHVEGNVKPHVVAALDLHEDEEPELLLCYNNTCHFQKLTDESMASTEFDFHWNSVPTAIACPFPYVIAFTADTMEIRLIINGNLVHTIAMPNLNLISSKHDIFFATTSPEFLGSRCDRIRVDSKSDKDEKNGSPPPTQVNFPSGQGDVKPMRIYRIPLQTLSRTTVTTCGQGRCPSPGEPEVVSAPPTADSKKFLSVEMPRVLSRSCSSSPTPNVPPPLPGSAK
ncbi:GTPase-activating Rap/Ran-GAP domain-like protein 3 isoform X2 [Orussus abietinus]|uniref:GTPase-activating Rap/Ran-GAP domain-like protein 3 isoform X2 n=1 Tax=Orussus abietinus TaxID=222816 RepID=UPI000625C8AC|nr:GTPase-activating Rap/Ran-GAP domain-like protein 3 isoform X2 [Orussus abietinus]